MCAQAQPRPRREDACRGSSHYGSRCRATGGGRGKPAKGGAGGAGGGYLFSSMAAVCLLFWSPYCSDISSTCQGITRACSGSQQGPLPRSLVPPQHGPGLAPSQRCPGATVRSQAARPQHRPLPTTTTPCRHPVPFLSSTKQPMCCPFTFRLVPVGQPSPRWGTRTRQEQCELEKASLIRGLL